MRARVQGASEGERRLRLDVAAAVLRQSCENAQIARASLRRRVGRARSQVGTAGVGALWWVRAGSWMSAAQHTYLARGRRPADGSCSRRSGRTCTGGSRRRRTRARAPSASRAASGSPACIVFGPPPTGSFSFVRCHSRRGERRRRVPTGKHAHGAAGGGGAPPRPAPLGATAGRVEARLPWTRRGGTLGRHHDRACGSGRSGATPRYARSARSAARICAIASAASEAPDDVFCVAAFANRHRRACTPTAGVAPGLEIPTSWRKNANATSSKRTRPSCASTVIGEL